MIKKLFLSIFLFSFLNNSVAQHYNEPGNEKKISVTEKSKDDTKQVASKTTVSESDTSTKKKTYLSGGFVLTGIASYKTNIGIDSYDLVVRGNNYIYSNGVYNIENATSYQIGISPGFQFAYYGIEFPFSYVRDRFLVKELSSNKLKLPYLEVGINQYLKLGKEKFFITGGLFTALNYVENIYAVGGFGFKLAKNLNASLVLKLPGIMSLIDDESTTIKAYKYTSSSSDNYVNYTPRSSVMLNIRYDLISTRKIKEKKIEPAKVAPVNNNTFVAPVSKPKIDYSKLSDEELKAAQKTATSNSDFDAIIGIQKELDKRQNEKEYESKSVEELKEMMKVSLEKEDYKKADLLQKIINKKENK